MAQLSSTSIYGNLTVNNNTTLKNDVLIASDKILTFDLTSASGVALKIGGGIGSADNTEPSISTGGDTLHLNGGNAGAVWIGYASSGGTVFGNGSAANVASISSGGAFSAIGTISSSLEIEAPTIGVSNSDATSGKGVSLYGGANVGQPTYGIMFAGTSTFGTHSVVTGDWATYLTMNASANRGWIFKSDTGTSGNVASISNSGVISADGDITTGGEFNLDTSASIAWNSTDGCIDFIIN